MSSDKRKVEPIHPWRWRALTVWIVVFTCLNFYAIRALRVDQHSIQSSRVHSCQQTYQSFNEVFRPFLGPPANRTAQQRKDIRKFHRTVHRLEAKCTRQTKPKP